MNVVIVSIPNDKKERETCELEMDLNFFCFCSNLSDENIISA